MYRNVLLTGIGIAAAVNLASCALNSGGGANAIQLEVQAAKKANPDFCNDYKTTAFTLMMGRLLNTKPADLAADVKEEMPGLDMTVDAMVEDAYSYTTQSLISGMNEVAIEFRDDWVSRTKACG